MWHTQSLAQLSAALVAIALPTANHFRGCGNTYRLISVVIFSRRITIAELLNSTGAIDDAC